MDEKVKINRVLHIVSAMDRGGAETLIMNVYRYLDKTRFQFDFVTHSLEKGDFEDEIEELGGIIYKIPSLGQSGPIAYVKKLVEVMKGQPYIAVHSHTDYQSGFPALAAKLAGIQHRICHSHSTNWLKGSRLKERVVLKVLQMVIKTSATSYCSCSEEAARFLFGDNITRKSKTSILRNGIDVNQFKENNRSFRENLIKELHLKDDVIIIGHVGKFSESKNQSYLLKVLKRLVAEDKRFVALLIGDGPLQEQIAAEAEELEVSNHIKFLGVRSDIPELMGAFDVFLFPSIFEGFGIVTIEAQCAGTPCILSDAVPKETDMGLGLVTYINLDDGAETWCNKIYQALLTERPKQKMIQEQITGRGFNIQDNINEWLNLYGIKTI